MNSRRSFLKRLFLGAAAVAVAPKVVEVVQAIPIIAPDKTDPEAHLRIHQEYMRKFVLSGDEVKQLMPQMRPFPKI